MPIFSRRVVQRLIQSCQRFLTPPQVAKFVADLNGQPLKVVQWEWELALLAALGKLGEVKYEPSLGGKSKPDVLFSFEGQPPSSLLAEVVTVSDAGAHKDNPIEELHIELSRLVRKRGLHPNHFSLAVGDDWRGIFHSGRNPRLKIPSKDRFSTDVFTDRFHRFLSKIRESPEEDRRYDVKTDRIELRVGYSPAQRFSSTSHLNYLVPISPERNTIFKALTKKARQLRAVKHPGPLGIFLCDGGCSVLAHSPRTFEITEADIINRFLQTRRYISFVQVFTVASHWDMGRGTRTLVLDSRLHKGLTFQDVGPGLRNVLPGIVKLLPTPADDPASARATLLRWPRRIGNSFRGGGTMTYKSARFSARGLLEFLAGRVNHREFLNQHSLTFGKQSLPRPNFFELMLRDGRLISRMEVVHCPDEDDDWVTIEFSEPDAAISKFTLPHSE